MIPNSRFQKRITLQHAVLVLCFFWMFQDGFAQDNPQKEITVVQKAHNKQLKLEEFTISKKGHFKVKPFTVETPEIHTIHHWFLQVLTHDNLYVNFGRVALIRGYLKSDDTIAFTFMKPVASLCNEGKYILGFAKIKTPGIYVLALEVSNFGVTDEIELEIEILNSEANE